MLVLACLIIGLRYYMKFIPEHKTPVTFPLRSRGRAPVHEAESPAG